MKIIARDIPPRTVWALEQAGVHPLRSIELHPDQPLLRRQAGCCRD